MPTTRREQVLRLYHLALARDADERGAFLAGACAGDVDLRHQVEALLAAEPPSDFLEAPAGVPEFALAGAVVGGDAPATAAPTALQAGRQFGVYRVEARLGAGGMGQVFRAVDTRLNRPVAIKVCAARFGERFDREARAIAAFNHPHICTLYDIGPDYLVMELIEGDTLSARIRKGPLAMEEVLRYGAQIADALTEAHRAGIVHRDLKPGNVMITRHGVKVLDFGLAKMTETLEATVTQPFSVLGTPAYMAPEQIAGRDAGARSDLFALGLVLYEMTTGLLPVPGASLGSAMLGGSAATVTPPSRHRADAPPALDDLIARLLAVDPAQRPASAADVAARLRTLAAPKSRGIRPRVASGVAAIVVLAIATAWWLARGAGGPVPLEVASITPITNLPGNKLDPAYSPDGSAIAFSWRGQDGRSPGIYVVDGDARVPRRLTQSEFVDVAPAWSPDGTEIAFERLRAAGGANELIVVSATGGPERKLRDVRQSVPLAGTSRPLLTWMPDGSAIVTPTLDVDAGGRASLFRIGAHGDSSSGCLAAQWEMATAIRPCRLTGDGWPMRCQSGAAPACSCAAWDAMACRTARHRKYLAASGPLPHQCVRRRGRPMAVG